ncbi:MAG: hypothetical protein ABSE18_01985 [Minisyncoccia bacterium]|jgi:hypothetical protein
MKHSFRKFSRLFFIAFAFAAILLLGSAERSLAAFGISPPFINADHLVPGVTYSQTVYLVQDQPDQNLEIRAALSVPDHIKPWISFDTGNDFIIPQGTRQFPVQITITVPKGESLGKYTGNVSFQSVPGKTGQVTIALGVNVSLSLTVGNDIYEKYSVPLIAFPDIEEGWNPKVAVRFENDGNIPESFDAATFDLYDEYDAVRLAFAEKQSGFPITPPFVTSNYVIEFPTSFHLGVGDYWAVVNFYKDNQAVASQKTVFHVLPAGSLSPTGLLLSSLKTYWYYYLVGLIVLLLIGRRLWIFRLRKKRAVVE